MYEYKDTMYCAKCKRDVGVDFVSKECIAMYGSVVYTTGHCSHCGKVVLPEQLVDDSGLIPPKKDW